MTEFRFNPPPDPPDGQVWCLACLINAKKQIIERAEEAHPDWPDLVKDGKNQIKWIPWDREIHLHLAVTKGLTEDTRLGMVDVCWTHLAVPPPDRGQVSHFPSGLIKGRG